MKHFKISIIAVVAIVMGIAASAFTIDEPVKADKGLNPVWFKFTGDPSNLSQLKNSMNYSYVDGEACSGQDVICAVLYTPTTDGQHPVAFDSNFQTRITNVYNGSTDPAISEEDE